MKKLFGVLIGLIGIAAGIWIDLWFFFIGGIKEIVAGFTATPKDGGAIGWGIAKATLFTGAGTTVAVLLVMAGIALAMSRAFRPRRRSRKSQHPSGLTTPARFDSTGQFSEHQNFWQDARMPSFDDLDRLNESPPLERYWQQARPPSGFPPGFNPTNKR